MISPPTGLPYHLSQLAALCRRHPTARKFLFVPSRQVGYNLLTALARAGVDWVNFEAMSPREHVERQFEPILRAAGLSPLHADLAIVTVAELLRELKERESSNYFEPVGVTPSLARSVWETLQALRMAGVTGQEMRTGPAQTKKTTALAYLLDRLDEVLVQRGHYDPAYALNFAIRHAVPSADGSLAVVMDASPLTRRGLGYLRKVFADRIVRIGRDDYGVPVPGAVGASLLSEEPVDGGRIGYAGAVKRRGITDEEAPFVHLFGSRGPDAELGDVVRFCLEHSVPFDEVEIAYTNASVYVPQLVDLADRFRLNVSFAEGVPSTLTRPGAGLKGLLDWIGGGCSARLLDAMLSAGLLSFHRAVDDVRPTDIPGLTSHFRLAALDEGIHRYVPALERLASSRNRWNRESEASTETKFQRRSRLLTKCIETLVEIVPSGTSMSTAEVSRFCIDFLDRFAVVHGERDERAVESLRDRFIQFGAISETRLPKWLALQLAADMVERHTVQASTAGPGAIHAVSVERAAYAGRKHLFVVGLDVDNFPGRSAEDPILLDVERQQLSLNLELKSSQATDRIWHLVRALGMAPEHVHMSASVFNAEREEAVVYPSPFFQSVAKQLGLNYLNPPQATPQPFHLDDTSALLPQRRQGDYKAFVAERFPWMLSGASATEARKSDQFSAYDGLLAESGDSFQHSDEGVVFSPNRIEKLAACPYRYYLHYVLGVRKPDYYKPDPTRWLDPRDFGTLLHDLYHRFLQELRETGERPDPERHGDRIRELVDEFVDTYRQRVPADNQAAYTYERQRLAASAMVFLRTEASDPAARPSLFEFVFGSDEATDEQLARPISIELSTELRFLLRGRIDRVDVLPDASLAIWDYKTGSSYSFDQGSLLRGGLNLQWVLYAYAMEELAPILGLPGRVAKSGYYFASDRENGRRIAEPPPERAAMNRVLAPLFSMVRQGAFLHVTKDAGACKFCDFRTVCRTEAKTKKTLGRMWMANADLPCTDALANWMEED